MSWYVPRKGVATFFSKATGYGTTTLNQPPPRRVAFLSLSLPYTYTHVYKQYLFQRFGFADLTEQQFEAKAQVFLLGGYSTGKTTMIR